MYLQDNERTAIKKVAYEVRRFLYYVLDILAHLISTAKFPIQ